MPSDAFHSMWAVRVGEDWFRCRACNFMGRLVDAIRHAVEQQRPA